MTRLIALFLICSALAGCGVEGEPIKPEYSGAVTINNNGIYPALGVNTGRWSLFLGL